MHNDGSQKETDQAHDGPRKQALIKHADGHKITQKELARWAKRTFNLGKIPTQATISRILSSKKTYMNVAASMGKNCKIKK